MVPKPYRDSTGGMRCPLCVQSSLHPVWRGLHSATSPEMTLRRMPHIASDTTEVWMRFARMAGRVRDTFAGSTNQIAGFFAVSMVWHVQLGGLVKIQKPHVAHNLPFSSIRAVLEGIHAEGWWIHPRWRPKLSIRI